MNCHFCGPTSVPPVGSIDGWTDGKGRFAPHPVGECTYWVCPDCLRREEVAPEEGEGKDEGLPRQRPGA